MKSRSRILRGTAILAVGASAIALSVSGGPANASSKPRHVLAKSQAKWLEKAHSHGAMAKSTQVHFGVLLAMRNQAQADQQVRALSDPHSASYGKWLSGAQFRSRYAPTKSQVGAVQSWLREQGFKVTKTLPSGMLVQASGSAATVNKAFGTTMKDYTFKGKAVHANATELSVAPTTPAAVTGAIKAIVGLDTGGILKKPADTAPGPAAGFRAGHPCSAYFGQKPATDKPEAYGKHWSYAVCGYSPKQLESAYGVKSAIKKGNNGRGQTVVITDAYASPTIVKDLQKYNKKFGLPQFKKGQFTQDIPGADGYDDVADCGGNGWYGEETLDIEAVHTMAPGAKIVYKGAADCESALDNAWAGAIDTHQGNIITNSWGDGVDTVADLGQSYIDFYQQYSTEAALRGITVNFSSGDDGDQTAGNTNPDDKSLSFPSDLPYVTAVGGTSIAINKNGKRTGEWGWSNAYSSLTDGAWSPAPPGTFSSGGGGGTSQLFPQPWYQTGIVPDSIADYYGDGNMRSTPDISMVGDPNTGFLVGQTQQFSDGTYWDVYRIGGTSLSSPLMAGVVALANQKAHKALGFVNPLYYDLQGTRAVNDITPPKSPLAQVRTNYVNSENKSGGLAYLLASIDVQDQTIHTAKGWDDETGVGTPNGLTFLSAITRAAR